MLNTGLSALQAEPGTTPRARHEELALKLAQQLSACKPQIDEFPIPERLVELQEFFQAAYHHFDKATKTDVSVSQVAEWLLDNFYVLEQAIRQLEEDLPADYYQRLPKTADGWPRSYVVALGITRQDDSRLDIEQIRTFARSFQTITPLRIGELWALPLMLRWTVLEALAEALAEITRLKWKAVYHPALWSTIRSDSPEIFPEADLPYFTTQAVAVNCILNLRLLATQNWKAFFESASVLERILRTDPLNIYSHMDFETRNQYRHVIEELAQGSSMEEVDIASRAIQLAQAGSAPAEKHVGYYLIGPGRARLEGTVQYRPDAYGLLVHTVQKLNTLSYVGSIGILTILASFMMASYALLAGGSTAQIILALLLALLPSSAVAVHLVNWLVVSIIPPRTLPKLDFQAGVPLEFRTMVVIPALLSTERDAPFLTRQIENHFLANSDRNIFLALLTDYADAPEKEMPGDRQLLEQASAAIERLNRKYGRKGYRPFFLFHRERAWNASEDRWMGWERKRGKLEEFNKLLRGISTTSFVTQMGDLTVLPTIRFVITLDADTLLPRDCARRLIGTLAHPLNQAIFDPLSGEVKAGYTVLQPRVQVRPAAANQSLFTRIYSGDSVIDLYSRAVSDVYQDLFGEGTYVGKGIYHVDAFQRSLDGRVPENRLLSHDLFEGLHGRCALVTDIVLFEDYPPHYLAYTDRLHRWVRGDWQLLPWLGLRVPHRTEGSAPNTLSVIDRWKLLDNLRRSLVPPAVLALLVCSWLVLPGPRLLWTLFALSPYVVSILINLISAVRHNVSGEQFGAERQPVKLAALRALFEVIFLPHESIIILDAIATTLSRMWFTRKRMLEWVTAAHTVQAFGRSLKVRAAWRAMVIAPLSAFALAIFVWIFYPLTLLASAPLLVGWIISPYLAARLGRPTRHAVRRLEPDHERKLRLLARTTWLYFEHFIGPDDRWLPPDHFQESPRGLVAHHTSPTNIGLMLLATLSAHDMGYVGPLELSLRIRDSFDSMDALERVRGHFLNWYDTRTFAPLPPRYISTVDSGNLAACMLTLRQGLGEIPNSPVVQPDGLLGTLDVLAYVLEQAQFDDVTTELPGVIESLITRVKALQDPGGFSPAALAELFNAGRAELENMLWELVQTSGEDIAPDTWRSLSTWIDRVRYQLKSIRTNLEALAPWLLSLPNAPQSLQLPDTKPKLASAWKDLHGMLSSNCLLGEIPDLCMRAARSIRQIMDLLDKDDKDAVTWCETLSGDLDNARKRTTLLFQEYADLAARADSFFQAMNFSFLFDAQRHVFHIGYNVESGRLDSSYYDLMASEARIASLIAIARGDVPQSHWLYLARPLTQLNGTRALLSWSGTMFEYLMPTLFVESYPNTLMDQSCHAAVEEQMQYAAERSIPWGTSEASYHAFDSVQVYQYQAFGIPSLGYKRGLSDDLVVAPYASMLALPLLPQAVIQNLAWLEKLKMWGQYGLYESVDFTPERLKTGQEYAIIRTFMAHHQGMILLSIHNYLLNKSMVRRFHADPRIGSVELLLQEQTAVNAPTEHPRPQQVDSTRGTYTTISLDPWHVSPDAPYAQLHCLSNGNYSLLITAAGSGFSRWGDLELTRWRPDSTLDDWGSWMYLEDRVNGQLWSATRQPAAIPPDSQDVRFFPQRVEFERRDGDLVVRTTVHVAPYDDVEIRRVSLTNHGNRSRTLGLTSYSEIILAQQAVDQRHPAFNKLFIESEFLSKENVLLFRRRPRAADEKPIFLAHFFIGNRVQATLTGYETDRARFLGRGGICRRPEVFAAPRASVLSNTTGATLDPVCALQAEVLLPAYGTAEIAFITLVAHSRKEALELARRYRSWAQIRRAIDDGRMHAERELSQLSLTSKEVQQIQKLLSPLLYPSPVLRAEAATLQANTLGQSGLWSFGISGDYPILLVRLKGDDDLPLLGESLSAHAYWRKRGLMIDLVILNLRETSYEQEFHTKILRMLNRSSSGGWLNKRGGIFVLREDQMNESERTLLAAVARVVLDGEAGPLEKQLARLDAVPVRLPRFTPIEPLVPVLDEIRDVERESHLLFDNGLGGFTPDAREYVIHLAPGESTPAPWINVLATQQFGCLVSESGLGCTWSQNSGENRLTPWRNDPVSDPPSEAIYLRDEDTGQIWSPTPLPARADAPYLIRHGAGYSVFEHASHGLNQTVRVFVAPNEPVKVVQVKLRNKTKRMRRINVTYYAEWVLGTTHENTAPYIVPEFAAERFALLARNGYDMDYPERVAFLASTREPLGITTDRTEFLGLHGNYTRPAALERVGLTSRVQPGVDPCAAWQLLLWLQPGEEKEVTFLLGQGADRAEALRLITHYQNIQNIQRAWQELTEFWDEILGQIQVRTPDAGMDLLINRWLLYQSLACRIWGRTAFYQSSGAYGFRDQLQDVMGLIHVRPELTRQHILEAAAHQFEEGDVLHWWHPPEGRGIRTRCSDNLLWLPYVTAHYVMTTGDRSILDEKIPFLSAEPLKAREVEYYGHFPAGQVGTLYEHCCRALVKAITAGPHGIPLMGAHDWNDGMNRVGINGTGESVWLGWFLAGTLKQFAAICKLTGDPERAEEYLVQADAILKALEASGWDGEWYLRAYYDDGSPLGSSQNDECRIDSIAQSWAVLSGGADDQRARRAMGSVTERLVRYEDALILLFTPAFERTPRDPGYIKGYPPGIRENGGQYTHAALWAIWALADLGQGDRAVELFQLINPIHHADTPEKVERYRVEPYVIAADVYSRPPYTGRGGWTWYTGSASWMYRLGVERLLGLNRLGDKLQVNPSIPNAWKQYEVDYRFGKTIYHIQVRNPEGVNRGSSQIVLDGKKLKGSDVRLVDDGQSHEVVVTLH